MTDTPDRKRRKLLAAGTAIVGGTGVAGSSAPFLASWAPSARARALGAPVEVDLSDIAPGEMKVVEWRRAPVWVVHRTPEMVQGLRAPASGLRDPDSAVDSQQPDYARNAGRSVREEYLVLTGTCTHLGCSPTFRPDFPADDIDTNWRGGFFCPCHRSKFDLAGRVYQGVPAPTNLVVPPHRYLSESRLLIGEHPDQA